MNQEPVGIIGVGLVGNAIADRLADNNIPVYGFDIAGVANSNVDPSPDLAGVFNRCQTVLLSLPDSSVVHDVLAAARLRASQLVIDTTTGKPEDAIGHRRLLEASGGDYIEATIAGSSELLSKGEATLFLGGAPESIASAEAVLAALSPRRFHIGAVGMGSRFKLVFNLILGLQRAALAEALCFAQSQGIPPAEALGILRHTPAFSSVMDTKGERMVGRDFTHPQARLSQHLKDVELILAAGAVTPLSKTHRQLLEAAVDLGYGSADNSAIIEAFADQN